MRSGETSLTLLFEGLRVPRKGRNLDVESDPVDSRMPRPERSSKKRTEKRKRRIHVGEDLHGLRAGRTRCRSKAQELLQRETLTQRMEREDAPESTQIGMKKWKTKRKGRNLSGENKSVLTRKGEVTGLEMVSTRARTCSTVLHSGGYGGLGSQKTVGGPPSGLLKSAASE